MQHCIPSTSEHTDKPSLLAAILAYLIRYDVSSGGEGLPPVTDELVCTTLQSMYSKKLPVISIPAFLCGEACVSDGLLLEGMACISDRLHLEGMVCVGGGVFFLQ